LHGSTVTPAIMFEESSHVMYVLQGKRSRGFG